MVFTDSIILVQARCRVSLCAWRNENALLQLLPRRLRRVRSIYYLPSARSVPPPATCTTNICDCFSCSRALSVRGTGKILRADDPLATADADGRKRQGLNLPFSKVLCTHRISLACYFRCAKRRGPLFLPTPFLSLGVYVCHDKVDQITNHKALHKRLAVSSLIDVMSSRRVRAVTIRLDPS
jgi:hypothetical protein